MTVSTAALMPVDSALLRALLDSIPARVVVIDRDHRYLFANTESLAFFGRTESDMVGRHASEVVGPGYAAYGAMHERIFERGETVREEAWIDYAVHGRRWVQHLILPYAPVGTQVQAAFVFARDLTDLKQREADLAAKLEELASTQALKSSIVDHALAAIITTDDAGHIVEFNPAAQEMFGQARDAVVGQCLGDILIPERLRAAFVASTVRLAEGKPAADSGRRTEMLALHADGHEFSVEVLLWRTTVGGRGYITASMFDLTERHDAQRQIERQREALRQGEKLSMMGSLLASVAHELNNPLAIVMGRAALLEEQAALLPQLAGNAQKIHHAAQRCGRIVRTFLNMARERPMTRAPVQINDVVCATTEILAYSLRSHGVTLQLDLAPQLPAAMADADQLGQVVLNLLVNAQQALAAMPVEHRRVQVQTGSKAAALGQGDAQNQVWLRVADHGLGVPLDIRQRLFDPFFTTKEEGAGTGLGLSVSRSIAREHGGELCLEHTAQGASFLLTLPVGTPAAPADSEAMPLDAPAVQRARLLVVDDEPEIVSLLEELLQRQGHEVVAVGSGAEALHQLGLRRFDAVISDLHMPDVDGAALWREIRKHQPALRRRVLFVTGDSMSPHVRRFLEQTRCETLVKPFSKADLLTKLAALLDPTASVD